MKTKPLTAVGIVFAIILFLFILHNTSGLNVLNSSNDGSTKEYLFITTTAYTNGKNDDDGVNLILYVYSIEQDKIEEVMNIPINSQYPANCVDVSGKKVYFSDGKKGDGYDNLYEYDLKTKKIQQLSFGKFEFDDILLVNNRIIVNTARQYATVTQPAIFDPKTKDFAYLNPNDDDTWFYSLSYNYSTKKLLTLTTSDAVMRSYRVAAETHIRPKTLYLMDADFSNRKPIYSTEQFEIRMTRQLDANRIFMTTDPYMGSGVPRTLKMLNIDTKQVTDFDIPGIKEVYAFYPRNNTEGLFVMGRNTENKYGVFYYDLVNKKLSNVFENYKLPDNHRSFVDIVYSMQTN